MALTFSITGGADAAKFTIGASSGALAFKTAPDFEQPGDADTNNIYVVEVGVSDGIATTKQTINVTVTDMPENLPPQITSPATAAVKEGDTAVMTVTATDPDAPPAGQPPVVSNGTFTATAGTAGTVGTMSATNSPTAWSITGGNSAGHFSISNAGVISAAASVVAGSYSLTCRATNAAGNGTGTASITVTASGAFVWPNESNTGVPAGTTLTAYTGPTVIQTNGTVIQNKRITVALEIAASDVRIERCEIQHGGWWGINSDQGNRLTVKDCTFKGPGTGGQMAAAVLGDGTFERNNVSGTSFGFNLQGVSTVKFNYIHALGYGGSDPHYDGIMVQGGNSNTLIEDNWVEVPGSGGTAGILITPQFGDISNVTVNHNRFLGVPSYQAYATKDASVGALSGVVFTNNEMQRGAYGYWNILGNTPVRTGNKDAFSGANIDNA